MIRCESCVIPEGKFNLATEGECQFCTSSKMKKVGDPEVFKKMLETEKSESERLGRKYDCVLMVSGGKDSLSTLYRLVHDYGLKVLGFNYDGGFTEPQAKENLRSAIDILNVDLEVNDDGSHQRDYLRHNILFLTKQPPSRLPTFSHLLCVGCVEGCIRPAFAMAKRHGVNLVLSGGNPTEVDFRYFFTPFGDDQYQYISQGIPHYFAKKFLEVATSPGMWNPVYGKNIRNHLSLGEIAGVVLGKLPSSRPTLLSFYNHVEWNEREILDLVEGNLNWSRPKGRSTTTRFDCQIHVLLDRIRKRHMGVSEKEITYSVMAKSGMITREEAMSRIEAEESEESEIADQIVRELLEILEIGDHFDDVRKLYS